MSRSARLFDLLHALRRHRRPVSGQALAGEMGVSIRTLYRDIATLQAQGAGIQGEPGIGYVLQPGFLLPPLMFSPDEIEALVLGARWVAERADAGLGDSARSALARIAAVLPPGLRQELEVSTLLVGAGSGRAGEAIADRPLREAIRSQCKLELAYRDQKGALSHRITWPFALAYFDRTHVLISWCELRSDFRYFRTERIVKAELLTERYPQHRQSLLKAWRRTQTTDRGTTVLPEIDSMYP